MENWKPAVGQNRGHTVLRRIAAMTGSWLLGLSIASATQAAALSPGIETISPNPVIAVIEQSLRPLAQSRRVALASSRFAGPVAIQPGLQIHRGDRLTSSGGVRVLLRCANGAMLDLGGAFDVSMTGSCAFDVERGQFIGETTAGRLTLSARGASLTLEHGVAGVLAPEAGAVPSWRVFTGAAGLLVNGKTLALKGGQKALAGNGAGPSLQTLTASDRARAANILARLKAVTSPGASDYQQAVRHYSALRNEYLRAFGQDRALADGQRVDDQELELGAVADVDNLLAVRPDAIDAEGSVATRIDAWALPDQGALIGSNIATQVTPPETPRGFIPPSGAVRDF